MSSSSSSTTTTTANTYNNKYLAKNNANSNGPGAKPPGPGPGGLNWEQLILANQTRLTKSLIASIVGLLLIYYSVVLNDVSLLTLAAHLVSLAQTAFLLFSLFTWLYLLATHLNLAPYLISDHRLIYSGFLLAFVAEFLLQFVILNCSTKSSTTTTTNVLVKEHSSNFFALVEWENLMFVGMLLTITTIFLLFVVTPQNNYSQSSVYSRIVLVTVLTRIYGSFSFGTVLPQSICAYCAYTSAFAGLLFAHYINYILDCIHIVNNNANVNTVNNSSPQITSISNEDMNNNNNNKKAASNSRRRSSLKEQRDKLQQQRKQRRNRRSDDDEDEDTDECRDNCEQRCRFESLLEANRQQRSSQQQNRISVASFRRRTSLPTIKFDKSSASDLVNHHHSVTTGSVAIVVREIKSRIDDLMSDVSTASPSSSSPTASSPTTSDPVATTITQQQQQQQTVNRLLSGLRTIRNIINRSALNQLVIADRQSRQQQQQHQYKHSSSTSHSPQPNHQTTQQLSNKVMISNSTTANAVKKSIEICVNRLHEDVSPSSAAAASSNDASSHNDHEKTKIVYESNQEDYDPQENDEDEDDDDRGIIMNNINRHQVAAEDNDEYDNDDEDDDEEEEEEDEDELERRRNSYSADEGVATSEDRAVRRRRRHNNNSQQQQSTAQSTPLQQLSAQPPTTSTSGRNRKSLPTQIYRRMFTQNTTSTSSTKSTTIRFDASSNSTNSSRQRSLSLKYSTNNSETPTTATATNKRLNNEPTNQKPNTSTTKRNSPTSGDQQQQQSLSMEREKALYNESLPAEKSLKENHQTNVNTTADSNNAKSSSNNSNIMSSPSLQQQQQQQQQSSSSTPISQIQTSNSILSNKTSDYESGESPTNSDCNSDTDKLQIQRQQQQQQHNNSRNNQSSGVEKSSSSSTPNQYHTQLSLKRLDQIKEEFGKCARNAQKYHHHDLLYNHFQQMSQQQQQQQTNSNSNSPVTTTTATTTSVTSCSASPSTTTNLTADGDDECCEDDEEDDMYIGACDVEDDVANNNCYDDENGEKSVWQHPEDLEKNADLLNCLHDWNFPIFRFGERSKKFILSQMACKIFDEIGLFKAFDIQIDKFINFFTALESGYIDLPYHNRIHAADVLHACYYLTTQAVPNCMHTNKSVSHALMKLSENRKRTRLDPHQYALNYSLSGNTSTTSTTNGGGENGYGCLGDNFTQLEILALYCSAAMHDYEHPGRNNAFLITISSPLAILYNDKSVLENHHASASWLLLKSNENFNFLSSLDASEWKRLRFLVIENILATDLGRHFTIINEFNTKYNKSRPMGTCKETGILSSEGEKNIAYDFGKDESTAHINWTNDSDRLLISQMILKLADINAPLKREELHVQWTYRIVEEFYQQGDEEMSLGLPMSPYMDRKQPQVAKLQESFINVLVGTLCDAYTFAGLLPGTLIDENEEEEEGSSEKSSPTESPTTSLPPSPLSPLAKPKRFQSEMINNLKSNYKMWCGKMKIEEEELAKKRASLTTEPS